MKSVINWFEIPVSDMDRAIKFYEPVMQLVAIKRLSARGIKKFILCRPEKPSWTRNH